MFNSGTCLGICYNDIGTLLRVMCRETVDVCVGGTRRRSRQAISKSKSMRSNGGDGTPAAAQGRSTKVILRFLVEAADAMGTGKGYLQKNIPQNQPRN
eukprot:2923903-Amphidinium_carterae.2